MLGNISDKDIAVIGMSGRFPKSPNLETFWENLKLGRECVSFFSDEDLIEEDTDIDQLGNPDYVKACGYLENTDLFDAGFFKYSPLEAEIIDPQQRIFLECAWEALEAAGCDPKRFREQIGVFAGSGINRYGYYIAEKAQHLLTTAGKYQLTLSNEKDYLATRTSYKLDLKGPSITLQTACSTSLVAIHVACQNLLSGECDIALAGGVSIRDFKKGGYLYQEGGILSPDGHCRAFDGNAQGMVRGNGAGVVVLQRLEDAIESAYPILAVVKGTAINNDGAEKIGFTAPSIEGQFRVIREAMALGEVDPESIDYVEAHGTGTELGDPIEIAALTEAYRMGTTKKRYCAIGTVKSNIGHLDAAAGVAGFIKAILALRNKQIPASLHYEKPNPKINFDESPFYVNTKLRDWKANGTPRRAGVSSFGIGGTNAHVVLQEAPRFEIERDEAAGPALIPFSAKTDTALEALTKNLSAHLESNRCEFLHDVAYTLQVGRQVFPYRRIAVARTNSEAVSILKTLFHGNVYTGIEERNEIERPVAFLFSGQGSQHMQMGCSLYECEHVYKGIVDFCSEKLEPYLELDLRRLLRNELDAGDLDRFGCKSCDELLCQTRFAQPALFVVEYALSKLWASWGIKPKWMLGHSIGEYVAACLAGVFSLDDALHIVALRGHLMHEMPPGGMLAVPLSEDDVLGMLKKDLSLAVVNGPCSCVISGDEKALELFETALLDKGLEGRRLYVSRAFHSKMMISAAEALVMEFEKICLSAPQIRFISNISGKWILDEEATNPKYWGRHLLETVRFAEGLSVIKSEGCRVFLEVGPSQVLRSLSLQNFGREKEISCFASLPEAKDILTKDIDSDDYCHLLVSLGRLWISGISVDWNGLQKGDRRRRVPLPSYPFERQCYWVDAYDGKDEESAFSDESTRKHKSVADWFYTPSWKRMDLAVESHGDTEESYGWLVFSDDGAMVSELSDRLLEMGHAVRIVRKGSSFLEGNDGVFEIDPGSEADYRLLFETLEKEDFKANRILHLWTLMDRFDGERQLQSNSWIDKMLELGFYSLMNLAKAIGVSDHSHAIHLGFVTNQLYEIVGYEEIIAEKALSLGPVRVIPVEYHNISTICIDILNSDIRNPHQDSLIDRLIKEVSAKNISGVVAFRGKHRWIESFEPIQVDLCREEPALLRQRGVYLITGGFGGVGFTLARFLAESFQARLVIVGRSALPEKKEWDSWLTEHLDSHPVSERIRQARALEDLGGEVISIEADVADIEAMREGISYAKKYFGKIDGVIHAAGVAGGGVIQLKTRDAANRVLAPKVQGTQVINSIFENFPLDFIFLCSSSTAYTHNFGQVDYCSANAYLDAYANQLCSCEGVRVISINWGAWKEVGMAVDVELPENLKKVALERLERYGITSNEGVEIFKRILNSDLDRVLISTQTFTTKRVIAKQSVEDFALAVSSPKEKHERPELLSAFVEPVGSVEKAIAEIWQVHLGIDKIGRDDNFIELGGHSLMAVSLVSKINKNLEVDLPLKEFFEYPTIQEFASRVVKASKSSYVKIEAVAKGDSYPASSQQSRLYFMNRMSPKGLEFHLKYRICIRGDLDVRDLQSAFQSVIERHEALRTNFDVLDGKVIQIIRECVEFSIEYEDDSKSTLADLNVSFGKPFDLGKDLLMRVKLVKRQAKEHWLLVDYHHIISDGISCNILEKDLLNALNGASLESLELQYKDYAAWEWQMLNSGGYDRELSFWRDRLAGASPDVELPLDHPRVANRSLRGKRYTQKLSGSLSALIHKMSRDENCTIFMVLISAFNVLLYRKTGQEDISLCTDSAGRFRPELEGIVGLFVNQLIIRTNLAENPRFLELLAQTRNEVIDANSNQMIPFDSIVDMLRPARETGYIPFGEVMFSYQDISHSINMESVVTFEPLDDGVDVSKRILTVIFREEGMQMIGTWTFASELFDAETVKELAQSFEALLQAIMDNRMARIDDFSINNNQSEVELDMRGKTEKLLDINQLKKARRKKNSSV